MFRPACLAFCLAFPMGPAAAQAVLSIPLPLGPDAAILSMRFACGDGEPFEVQYVNTEANALALIPIDGAMRVFVSAISGSGARYVSGPYEWWIKGEEATLRDAFEEDAPRDCSLQEGPAPR